jgi:hypothetical protein
VAVVVRRGRVVASVLTLVLSLCGVARAGTVYFVVAEPPGAAEQGDSFVLPLSAEADIVHARDLIARGPDAAGARLVFAEIVTGADGINRDVHADGEPLWDWHVSAFEGFGDGGIELVDGTPTLVQEDVRSWIVNTRRTDDSAAGHIGFWSYTVVAEMEAASVPLPAALPAGIIGLVAIVAARRWPGAPWRR